MRPQDASPLANQKLDAVLFWLAVLLALILIGVGIFFLVMPGTAAGLFGIPLSSASSLAYSHAAGVRDIALGLVLLVFLRLPNRRVQGLSICAIAVVPHSDMMIVLMHGGSPLLAYGLHGTATLALLALGIALVVRGLPASALRLLRRREPPGSA